MSRKKPVKLDEFAAMAGVCEVLKGFPEQQRERIIFAVRLKLKEEEPKKRVRKSKHANQAPNVVGVELPHFPDRGH